MWFSCGIEQILSSPHITKCSAYVAGKWGHQSMLIKVHVTVLGGHWDPCTATDWISYVIMHLKKCILLLYYKLTAVESMHKLSGYWNQKWPLTSII